MIGCSSYFDYLGYSVTGLKFYFSLAGEGMREAWDRQRPAGIEKLAGLLAGQGKREAWDRQRPAGIKKLAGLLAHLVE